MREDTKPHRTNSVLWFDSANPCLSLILNAWSLPGGAVWEVLKVLEGKGPAREPLKIAAHPGSSLVCSDMISFLHQMQSCLSQGCWSQGKIKQHPVAQGPCSTSCYKGRPEC